MPKTDEKKIESEDVAELSDEALDRSETGVELLTNCMGGCFG